MIKLLDKRVADKIAAGEVIDRPVSIVKELTENSIDAGATFVTIALKDGGKTYIRVTDNGSGIEEDQVELAFFRHATSKITQVEDLDAIDTLGFRGEALASICAVSRVELVTKCPSSNTGRRVIVEGSKVIENKPTGCPEGTTITVRDLFYNLPARHKFMASAASETRRIVDFLSRLALSYPDIRFNVINGNKTVFTTSGRGNILGNIVSIFGRDTGENLIPVDYSRDDFRLKGFVSDPGNTLSNRNRQIFCVNGRIVSSSVIERGIDKAYDERVFKGRFPLAFLFFTLPSSKLDVNIHPTKKEVRFDKNSDVEDFICEGIREALRSKESIPYFKVSDHVEAVVEEPIKIPVLKAEGDRELIQETEIVREKEESQEERQVDIKTILSTLREEKNTPKREEAVRDSEPVSVRPFEFENLKICGSLFNTYIAAEEGDTFYLIDQHAAHERVFYEKLMNNYKAEERLSQQMLLPMTIQVSPEVSAAEEQWMDEISSMGYRVEFFGNNSYIVREIPAFMETGEGESFLRDFFKELEERPDFTDRRAVEKIIKRSCKSAVKAGDLLSLQEIDALFRQLGECRNPFSCPHGRPVFIKMRKYEIEKMFKRV